MIRILTVAMIFLSTAAFGLSRYSIRNLRNGLSFEVQGEKFPEKRQPEWGPPAEIKLKSNCDRWELANGSSAGFDEQKHELWNVPDSMRITEFDMKEEMELKEKIQSEIREAISRLDSDVDEKQFRNDVRALLKHLLGLWK